MINIIIIIMSDTNLSEDLLDEFRVDSMKTQYSHEAVQLCVCDSSNKAFNVPLWATKYREWM